MADVLMVGVDGTSGRPLAAPIDDAAFADAVRENVIRTGENIATPNVAVEGVRRFRGIEPAPVLNLNDPRSAGWTYLVSADDPDRQAIARIVAPLAQHRGMREDQAPLLWNGDAPASWQTWLDRHYLGLASDGGPLPHYVLIVGGPEKIPFHFQAALGMAAGVGRIAFPSLAQLEVYVQKLLDIERATAAAVSRTALFFAPNGGEGDATFYSARDMAIPLASRARAQGRPTRELFDASATKAGLLEQIQRERPALVYTASHGLRINEEDEDRRRAMNGAIYCSASESTSMADRTVSAADVPSSEPFLEAAMLFQFACFGYGTPAVSDFAAYWPGVARHNAETDFIAALPQCLLAHPRGPVAYVGHVDLAWVQGFRNPVSAGDEPRVRERLAPFVKACDALLSGVPVGMAMRGMSVSYANSNFALADVYDDLRRNVRPLDGGFMQRLTDQFIRRNDAQNYLIFGDPAARLRLPSP